MLTNLIVANIKRGYYRTKPVYQYNHGMKLILAGVDLPVSYIVDFSNEKTGTSKPQVGDSTGVTIPDEFFQPGRTIYCWLRVHPTQTSGITCAVIEIPISPRATITDETPTPVQQSEIDEAIAALNAAVERADEAVEHYPHVEDYVWYIWDVSAGEYVSTGVPATGPQGEPGRDGIDGQDGAPGADGYSPSASVSKSGSTATITITDKNGTTTAQVNDGTNGQDGAPGTDGYSPSASVSKSGTVATITVTDKNGTTTASVKDGIDYRYTERQATSSFLEIYDAADQVPFGLSATLPQKSGDYTAVYIHCESHTRNLTSNCEIDLNEPLASGTVVLAPDGTVTVTPTQGEAYTMTVEPPVSYYIGCMVTCTDDNYASIDGFTVNYAIDTKGYTDAKFGEIVAPLEQYSYALRAYAAGEMFIKDDKLYRAKTSIAQFANFVVGTNCEETTVSGATVHDVQVNGTSILNQGVANVPIGGPSTLGVVKSATNNDYGIAIHSNGILTLTSAGSVRVKNGTSSTTPITPSIQHEAAFYGLAKVAGADMKDSSNSVGEYTETAKSKISDMLNAPVSVSGTTPTITAMAGVRYVCGEVSTLSVTVPESGIVDVTFTSGSTATVLTVTSAKTGVTAIKWANGFDDTSLEANTVYEINIMDGEYGVAAAWT